MPQIHQFPLGIILEMLILKASSPRSVNARVFVQLIYLRAFLKNDSHSLKPALKLFYSKSRINTNISNGSARKTLISTIVRKGSLSGN